MNAAAANRKVEHCRDDKKYEWTQYAIFHFTPDAMYEG
jgi:hypothetical protein